MITDPNFINLLKDDSAWRCILVEVTPRLGSQDTTLYLSSRAYSTGTADTPASTQYLDILQGGVKTTEEASVDGKASMSYGTIEVENNDGSYDYWFNGVWVNKNITILMGDVRWPRSQFIPVFKGKVANIDSSAKNRISIRLRDMLQVLNTPITEEKLGGTSDNKERLKPLLFGEAFNFEPLLVDAPNHEYQIHNGNSYYVFEVRDDGVPVAFTPTLSAGTFRLNASPSGTITVTAMGYADANGYPVDVASIIKVLVKNYGRVGNRLTDADIDLVNFAAFAAANPAPVGVYLSDKANVLETCQSLAASVGAMLSVSRQGKLRLLQIKPDPTNASGQAITVTTDDMVLGSFKMAQRLDVSAAVLLGYCQNYTVQTDLKSGVPESSKNLFSLDWLPITRQDDTVKDLYQLHSVPDQENVLLLDETDAIAEADRRLAIRKVPRTVYQFMGFADALNYDLGGTLFVQFPRWGLDNGAYGVIVGLEPDYLARRCTVKVMI